MPTVDQMLRAMSRDYAGVPHWALEKDYALSYLLAGIASTEGLGEWLILKGGTALRKFSFPNYRFSEDLDFSVRQDVEIGDVDSAMGQAIGEMERLLQERGPFGVQVERLLLREPHPTGQDAFTVRVRFPTHREAQCRLKVEITRDEPVLLPPKLQNLLHGFPEELTASLWCYALEEIVAEKLRALLQSRARLRARGWGASRVCRDYYDLWYILRGASLEKGEIPPVVAQKCAHRGVGFESPQDFIAPALVAVAQAEWDRQLRPFVADCPDVGQVLGELQPLVLDLWTR